MRYTKDDIKSNDIEKVEIKSIITEMGIVNCWALNVRKEPRPDADIIGVINESSEVIVDKSKSTDEYYKVCTASGIEGFCAKEYITIR